jgi:hypothetical protein
MDVIERFAALKTQRSELNLYVLVDGLAYANHVGERLTPESGVNRALFAGTADEPLAHAGPWLFQTNKIEDQLPALFRFEAAQPAVSWIITPMSLEGLAQLLQLRQDLWLPSGKTALLRLSDPRVLGNLFTVMTLEQKQEFFGLIEEWHFLQHKQRVWTGRNHA